MLYKFHRIEKIKGSESWLIQCKPDERCIIFHSVDSGTVLALAALFNSIDMLDTTAALIALACEVERTKVSALMLAENLTSIMNDAVYPFSYLISYQLPEPC